MNMLFGYETIKKIRQIEERAAALGFTIAAPDVTYSGRDCATLRPRFDELPHFSRDASIFTGTFQEIDVWLRGAEWNRQYLTTIIKATSHKKISEKEDQIRQQHLLNTLIAGEDKTP